MLRQEKGRKNHLEGTRETNILMNLEEVKETRIMDLLLTEEIVRENIIQHVATIIGMKHQVPEEGKTESTHQVVTQEVGALVYERISMQNVLVNSGKELGMTCSYALPLQVYWYLYQLLVWCHN